MAYEYDRFEREEGGGSFLMGLLAGTVLAEYLRTDAVFSNIRLRGLGFRFEYPTLEDGLQQVVGALRE